MTRDLDDVISTLKKKLGERAIMKGSDVPPLRCFPTGLASLDNLLGGGALWGRITTLAGKKASGKTSLALRVAGRFQKLGGHVFWFDAERAYDPKRATVLGVDNDKITVFDDIGTSEIMFNTIREVIRACAETRLKAFFVLDSLTATAPEKLDETLVTSTYGGGGSAIINNQAIRVWNASLRRNQMLWIINQLREAIGGMGDPDVLPGGKGQEFFASQIVYTREGKPITDGQVTVGTHVNFTVKKSRISAPKARGEIPFYYSTGFDDMRDLVNVAVAEEVLTKRGSWIDLPPGITLASGSTQVQGVDRLYDLIKEDKALLAALAKKVYEKICETPTWNGDEEDAT